MSHSDDLRPERAPAPEFYRDRMDRIEHTLIQTGAITVLSVVHDMGAEPPHHRYEIRHSGSLVAEPTSLAEVAEYLRDVAP